MDGGRKRPRDDKEEEEEGGYFLKSRKEARKEIGVLVTGNDRTCVEDAVWNSSTAVFEKIGIQFDKDTLYSLFEKQKNTPFSIIQEYVKDCGVSLVRSTQDYLHGGPAEINLLKSRTDLFIIQLQITYDNKDKKPHFYSAFYNAIKGYILDNRQYSRALYLEDEDRAFLSPPTSEEKTKTYVLWRTAISRRDLKVAIKNVYRFEAQ